MESSVSVAIYPLRGGIIVGLLNVVVRVVCRALKIVETVNVIIRWELGVLLLLRAVSPSQMFSVIVTSCKQNYGQNITENKMGLTGFDEHFTLHKLKNIIRITCLASTVTTELGFWTVILS